MLKDYLSKPTTPFQVDKSSNVAGLLDNMKNISFQGRTLAQAFAVWKNMLREDTLIFMGLSGAMVPAGMREIIVYLIKNRFIDCLVSTGANLFHDAHESLGNYHYIGSQHVNDAELYEKKVDRIYDTFANENEFRKLERLIDNWAHANLDLSRAYTTREFFYRWGEYLNSIKQADGIVTSAYESGVPIYCPSIADSSYGIALAERFKRNGKVVVFDVIGDVEETALLAARAPQTGVIYLGGGVPKNFIQQAEVTAIIHLGFDSPGHKFAIQIITDAPHWGGLSGCTFSEAESWGKINGDALTATCYCDVTIALPIIATALAQDGEETARKRNKPAFDLGRKLEFSFK
ncbi:MAG TPA: deoxyhypusine synthase [candidate division Zixibacteria bacterium]|nr:deoxyhypusine synthase [candidate division Zixibacteria bacterium]HEQ99956.1 deoxyhypusine synthase [candidate division Zixibacteria bacterium]